MKPLMSDTVFRAAEHDVVEKSKNQHYTMTHFV